jgi:hypothetical protein
LSPTTTDDAGLAILSVPGGFLGYYEVNADGYTPAILARSAQLASEAEMQGMANLSLLSAGAGIAGVTQQSDRTIAIISALDCNTNPAAGITFQVGNAAAGQQVVYLSGGLPSQGATATDDSGSALIFNTPPGSISLTAYLPDGRPIRTVTALVRLNWVTFLQLRPDQSTHAAPPSQ